MAIEGPSEERAPDVPRLLAAFVENLALAGGLVMLAGALMVCASVSLRWMTSNSIPGDFELVQMATALSAFAFFPYCQLRRSNIVVETFTARLPANLLAWLEAFWDVFYAIVAAFLAWRLAVGASETIANKTTTMISGVPIGWAIAAAAAMSALLAATALIMAFERIRRGT